MKSLFSFRGERSRAAYAAAAIPLFFSQHFVVAGLILLSEKRLVDAWWFWPNPLRALLGWAPNEHLLLGGIALYLAINWVLAAQSFRRARQAGANLRWAMLAIVPILQIPLILVLSLAPPQKKDAAAPTEDAEPNARAIMLGILLGAAICVVAVAFSTLLLGLYGFTLFIGAPIIVGVVTAYLARRETDCSFGAAATATGVALALTALALIAFAIEGLICLIVASPLILLMGVFGALIGYELARKRAPRSTMMASLALLPALMMSETAIPPRASFESVESIEIAANPAQVWDAVTHMHPIPEPPAAPFRWGLAYPIEGELVGEGVGAVRRGVFSTGVAYERVTEWAPPQKLSFIVLSDPPMLHELSPYERVHAPHVAHYFRTRDARFTITPLANGRTRLTLATHHDLDLEPAIYWLPIAQWAVAANKERVLNHFRRQAETAAQH